jgi:hypothetical protein
VLVKDDRWRGQHRTRTTLPATPNAGRMAKCSVGCMASTLLRAIARPFAHGQVRLTVEEDTMLSGLAKMKVIAAPRR